MEKRFKMQSLQRTTVFETILIFLLANRGPIALWHLKKNDVMSPGGNAALADLSESRRNHALPVSLGQKAQKEGGSVTAVLSSKGHEDSVGAWPLPSVGRRTIPAEVIRDTFYRDELSRSSARLQDRALQSWVGCHLVDFATNRGR